jgi:hypothetical protein
MPNGQPFEWGRAIVHFIFGAALGALVGWGAAARFDYSAWLTVPLTALGVGLIAAVYTDNFWLSFRDPGWRNHRGVGW